MVASIRAGYKLLKSGETKQVRSHPWLQLPETQLPYSQITGTGENTTERSISSPVAVFTPFTG